MPLSIRDIKINHSISNKIIRIATPFTMEFWLTIFLLYCMYLINRYIISSRWTNIIYIIIALIILFY
jgi:hypothetical protein